MSEEAPAKLTPKRRGRRTFGLDHLVVSGCDEKGPPTGGGLLLYTP